jgi:hypothetical protein
LGTCFADGAGTGVVRMRGASKLQCGCTPSEGNHQCSHCQ